MSGVGNGYLSGNMLVAFPFEDGQCLAWGSDSPETRNRMQLALERCFVDAVVYVDSEGLPEAQWPVVGSFSTRGNSISFKIGSGSGGDVPVSVASSSVAFPIVSGAAPWGRYMLVLSSEGIGDFVSLCSELSISPPARDTSSSSGRDGGSWLRLCAKCITVRQHGLSSLMVYDGVKPKSSGPHFVMRGDVSIRPGNNMRLLEPEEENGMELNAVPGAGLGPCPCMCEKSSGGNSKLAGPDGHARFFNDTCYDLEPLEKYVDGQGRITQPLKIHVKCTACCTCQMYEDIVNERLVPLAQAIRKAKSDIEEMLQKYNYQVGRFNTRISRAELSDVAMTMSAMPIGRNVSPKLGGKNVKGKMSRCAYTVVIRNSSYFKVRIRVLSITGTDSIVESSAAWSDEDGAPLSITGDSESGVAGKYFVVYPGRSLVVTYISMKNEKVKSVVTGGFSGSASVDVSYWKGSSVISLGRLSKSVEA